MVELTKQLVKVEEAFSRQSNHYDEVEKDNLVLQWMREQVRNHALSYVQTGQHILELNAGTGLDAVFFANNGCRVHAIDISEGMLNQLRKKVDLLKLHHRITVQKCSLTELENINHSQFDFIFSNFGGLNCVPDLTLVTKSISRLLKPGGFVTIVIMPKFCPWELALIFRGKFKTAFRRLRQNGALAQIEGVQFMAYYFSPRQVIRAFGQEFKIINLQGLASISPPPYMEKFPKRYPRLYRTLTAFDQLFSRITPFNKWADHFILTMQYNPN